MPVHRFQNPPTIHAPRGYTHVVDATAPGRTVYVSGQVGIAQDGKIATDFRAQAVQSLENLKAALAAAGAGLEHVVKITNYFVDISHIAIFREVRDSYFDTKAPPASTAVQIVKLAMPELLFEIEATAVVPDKKLWQRRNRYGPAQLGKTLPAASSACCSAVRPGACGWTGARFE